MPRPNSGRSGFTLTEILVIVAIVLIICAIAIPGLLSSRRASNERRASTSLKSISSAQADFRANDRDGNGVTDFWTADVKSLYSMTSALVAGAGTDPKDPPLKLIEEPIAAADGDGTFHPAAGENIPMTQFAPPASREGYWYMALLTDLNLKGSPKMTYKVETGGTPKMGSVHNLASFGFVAFPDTQSAGKYVFFVNENNTVFRRATTGVVRIGSAVPPGPNGLVPAHQNWPDDAELKSYWSKGGD